MVTEFCFLWVCMIKAWFDGSITFNPGGHAHSGVIIDLGGKRTELSECVPGEGPHSSNSAEHYGVTILLNWLKENNLTCEQIEVFGDSLMTVNQLNGKWRLVEGKRKKRLYRDIALNNVELVKEFKNIKFYCIPREKNTEADRLSRCS